MYLRHMGKMPKKFMHNSEALDKDEHVSLMKGTTVELANMLNLEIEVQGIEELVKYTEGELSTEDLIELETAPLRRGEEEERIEALYQRSSLQRD